MSKHKHVPRKSFVYIYIYIYILISYKFVLKIEILNSRNLKFVHFLQKMGIWFTENKQKISKKNKYKPKVYEV